MEQDYNNVNTLFVESPPPLPPPTEWTFVEDKFFEQCLVLYPEETPNRWQRIAAKFSRRSVEEIKQHFDILVHDVYEIDAGRVQIPDYSNDSMTPDPVLDSNNQTNFGSNSKQQAYGGRKSSKKGIPWTENEHRLFLLGLSKFGKGDWRKISRNVVITRTSTQVASHAQKYFLRQSSRKNERKRSSIHDITMADINLMIGHGEQNMVMGPVQMAPQLQQLPSTRYLVGEYGYPTQ